MGKALDNKYLKADLADAMESAGPLGWPIYVGGTYLFRTAVHNYIGRVLQFNHVCIVIEGGGLAVSGRWHEMLLNGKVDEYEPFVEPFAFSTDLLADVTPWRHEIPKEPI
jgi:hypothetical protein